MPSVTNISVSPGASSTTVSASTGSSITPSTLPCIESASVSPERTDDQRRGMAGRRDRRAHRVMLGRLEVCHHNGAELRLWRLLQDRAIEECERLSRAGSREHPRRAQRVAAESGELGRFRALAADVSDQRRVPAALREHVVEVATDLVAVAQRGEVGGEIESGCTWERGRQQARLQRLGDVVLALVEPIGLGVEACAVERQRAVVRERQQESPLVLGEGALARKADDEDAECAVGDRGAGDRRPPRIRHRAPSGDSGKSCRRSASVPTRTGVEVRAAAAAGIGASRLNRRRTSRAARRVPVLGEQLHLAVLPVDQADCRGSGSVLLDRLAHDGRSHVQRRQRAREAHAQGVETRGVARSLLRPLARPRLGLCQQRALQRLAAQLRHRREELGVGRTDLVRVVEEEVERTRGLAVDDQGKRVDRLRAVAERAGARREEGRELLVRARCDRAARPVGQGDAERLLDRHAREQARLRSREVPACDQLQRGAVGTAQDE